LNNARTLPRIGVLAIQGDYDAHAGALSEAGAEPVEVRKPEQLEGLDGLVLPGGESTTMLKFLERHSFFESLKQFVQKNPVFGTCAGTILLARQVLHPAQASLGVLDAVVERNAYGRQIDSAILTAPTELPGGNLKWSLSAPRGSSPLAPMSKLWPAAMAIRFWCVKAISWRPRFIPSFPRTGVCTGCLFRSWLAQNANKALNYGNRVRLPCKPVLPFNEHPVSIVDASKPKVE